ncbi:mitochondrial peripheral inner membrane protein [Xylographa bjoerkii]|nr:mitochondrial peripheral inner membrane protein [Xylographa bjoerkii]
MFKQMLTFRPVKHKKIGIHRLLGYSARFQKVKPIGQFPFLNARNLSTIQVARRGWPSYVLVFAFGFLGSVGFGWVQQVKDASPSDPATFKPYILELKEPVSSTSSIFILSSKLELAGLGRYDKAWQKGVWSVQIKQPQLQIARAYTPLPPSQDDKEPWTNGKLSFLIRQDPKGEVSGYLHKLPQGATIDLRGPHVEYQIPDGVTEILFVAGGTGIAPALQVAHTLYNARRGRGVAPKMHILWANRRREDCEGGVSDTVFKSSYTFNGWRNIFASKVENSIKPTANEQSNSSPMVLRLDSLKKSQTDLISVDYFVDEEQTTISEIVLKGILQSSIATVERSSIGRKLILVSGPDGFVKHFAGSKAWQNGKEVQGPLGGLLSQIDHSGWEIWKL